MNAIITTHNLNFEVTPFRIQIKGEPTNMCFRVGTCHGMYCCTEKTYDIIAIENDQKGNGHLQDVFEWFENSCKRDKKDLRIMEFMNQDFKKHLIEKRGFTPQGENNVIKYFNNWADELGKQKSFPHILILDEPVRTLFPMPDKEHMDKINAVFESAKKYVKDNDISVSHVNQEPIIMDSLKDLPPINPSKPTMGIIGGASAGKTAFAMSQANEATKAGKKVLIVASNPHLLASTVQTSPIPIHVLTEPREPINEPISGKEARRERRKKERDAKRGK